jgi:hypothetical protein
MTRKKVEFGSTSLPWEKWEEKGGIPLKEGNSFHLFVNL